MFDMNLPDLDALREADEAALVAAIGGWAQAEATAAARRLAAIAELRAGAFMTMPSTPGGHVMAGTR